MNYKKLKLLRQIQQGSDVAYLKLLLLNDKTQILQDIENSSPIYFAKKEADFYFNSAEQIAEEIVSDVKNGLVTFPKFKFIPKDNEYLEVIQRVNMLTI